MEKKATFIISLDYELMWGVRDKRTIDSYGDAIKGVGRAMDEMLNLFTKYNVKATIAIVGFLFHKNRTELLNRAPDIIPTYTDENLNPYLNIEKYLGENETSNPYYFGYSILRKIIGHKNIEVSTHTYSHYYCLEKGQTLAQFEEDLKTAIKLANEEGVDIKSIIFPRNQYSQEYLNCCRELGILSYRGTEENIIYKNDSEKSQTAVVRIKRLLDAYINLTGPNSYNTDNLNEDGLYNFPSSRLLRSYNKKLFFLEPLKLKRIKDSMTYAAKNNLLFHLWWHPHNFGRNTKENIEILEKILRHYKKLNSKFGIESSTMNNLTDKLNSNYEDNLSDR